MADVIHLLPDAIANQIAAGEVIQRPASVVKELVENAIDAGATEVIIHVVDAGRTLIRITDNGSGMSDTDARLAFERHATSKIRQAADLFAIQTFGFRGEALASIAAIAQVELKTRTSDSPVGTRVLIQGSEVIEQETVACNTGSAFSVRNIFYNTPARRKFLKGDPIEFRHILNEFFRTVLPNPGIGFQLHQDEEEVYRLPATATLQRIVQLFGKSFNQGLVRIGSETSLVKISGYIGKPEYAKKKSPEQYFFVNGRYIRHAYLHNAVLKAYDNLLQPETQPPYFIFLETDPGSLDVNIHPTKTEVKFEDEPSIWKLLHAAIRESLGKFNISPSIDFDNPRPLTIPVLASGSPVIPPQIRVDPQYNPFRPTGGEPPGQGRANLGSWDRLFDGFEARRGERGSAPPEPAPSGDRLVEGIDPSVDRIIQVGGRFLMTPVKSGVMVIDQALAHERVMYERLLLRMERLGNPGQQSLFPPVVELSAADAMALGEILDQAGQLGFDIRRVETRRFAIHALPADLDHLPPEDLIHDLIRSHLDESAGGPAQQREKIARSLAAAAARRYNKILSPNEMNQLLHELFACQNPAYSPVGKPTVRILPTTDLETFLG